MSFESDLLAWLPQLRRYARALTGDAAWADDLVQDTMEKALCAWRWRVGGNLRAWLFTLLRHRFIDQLRGRREIAMDDDDALWQSLPAPQGEVDGLALEEVQQALYRLPPELREALLLVAVEELSYREAAQVMGVPVGTVMSRLSRARERMRAAMEAQSGASEVIRTVSKR